ncbi:MAG: IS110 family transposase [Acidobacteria bacterium]|nr:IS110 family transposase [Acidobacteriota bacterium]
MYDKILGIDIAKATIDVALLPVQTPIAGQTDRPCRHHVANTPDGFATLTAWLTAQGVQHVYACFEATSTYGEALAAWLVAAGHTVVRANPYQTKHYAQSELQRNGTDRQMAACIARFARERQAQLPQWTPPDPALYTLQDLVRLAEDQQQLLGEVRNRLERPGHTAFVVASLTETVQHLEQQRAQTLQQIQRLIAEQPTLIAQVALLTTIPGVATTTAVALLAELGDVTRFASARQAAAYAGLTPAANQSGTTVSTTPHFAQHGNRRLRKALFYPALVAIRHDPRLRAFYQRLRAAGKAKMSAVGAVMHKLLKIAVALLRTKKPYDLSVGLQPLLTN